MAGVTALVPVRYAGGMKRLDGGGLVPARCTAGFLPPPGMVALSLWVPVIVSHGLICGSAGTGA